jgi:single-stranded DNA-binding protein
VTRLRKGAEVYVEGRLRQNTWIAADGAERVELKLTAWTIQPMGYARRRDRQKEAAATGSGTATSYADASRTLIARGEPCRLRADGIATCRRGWGG